MNFDIFITLSLLVICIILFALNKVRTDFIALSIITIFPLTGILTVEEVLQGFSDKNIILIALLFIIGESVVRSGIAYKISEILIKYSKNNENKVLIFLMLFVGLVGAFMSSTGVVAIFIPVVLLICQQINISVKKLLMPLGVAALISGMLTLIATPPNLVLNSELIKRTGMELKFFDFTILGSIILVTGIIYMLIVNRILFKNTQQEVNQENKHTIHDLINNYEVNNKLKRLVVKKGSTLIGKRINELNFREIYQIDVLSIERYKAFQPIFITDVENHEIREKDILLINLNNIMLEMIAFEKDYNLELAELKEGHFKEQTKSIGLVEATISPTGDFVGKTIKEIKLRTALHLNLIAIKRKDDIIKENVCEEKLQVGDLLLLFGSWKNINKIRQENNDLLILKYPEDVKNFISSPEKLIPTIFSIGFMIFLMVTNIVPNIIAALITILILCIFKVMDAKSSYSAIQYPALILIIGMIPFSTALQKTNAINLLIEQILPFVQQANLHVILAILFSITAVIGLFISNTATAILLAPVAIQLAQQLSINPIYFVMTVAIASSAAFMTPVSTPSNVMIFNAGNYKFSDFLKIGIPFTMIVGLITVFFVPILF